MSDKPSLAAGYRKNQVELVKQTCLYIATKLGDLIDEFVVVGGLVPSLLIPQEALTENENVHVGTMDLDLGLSLALLDSNKYEELTLRLRRAGFEPDVNQAGNPTFQRWKIESYSAPKITVDFAIAPSFDSDKGGNLRHIERDFAAVITPGLHLAFVDRQKIMLKGTTLAGEKASRYVWVCGPGAFVVLKAFAFGARGENKDAYDLYYVIRNYGNDIRDVFNHLKPLLRQWDTQQALKILQRDFSDPYSLGPRRVAEFLYAGPNEALQADVVGFVRELLIRCGFISSISWLT